MAGSPRRRSRVASAVRVLILSVFAWLPLGSLSARAESEILLSPERTQLQAKEQALFEQTLRNPADIDATLAYAEVATRLGDNEAAVTALERLLLFNPNLPRVDLELGTLYFRMGSLKFARAYFEKAAAVDAPPDVAARAKQYLGDLTEEESPSRFTGYVFTGVQYQSDASVAPASPLIHTPVGNVLLTEGLKGTNIHFFSQPFVKQADGSAFATGSALYSYDLGTQNRDSLEVLGTAFTDAYFHESKFDLNYAEVTLGPRFNVPDTIPGVVESSVKPYLIFNEVGIGRSQYFLSYGAGAEWRGVAMDDLSLKAMAEFREKSYSNSTYVDGGLLNGNDTLVSLELSKPVSLIPDSKLNLRFDFLNQSTHAAYYTNKSYGATLSYVVDYNDPTGLVHSPWETTLFGGAIWNNYASPDPCCSTNPNPAIFSPSTRFDRHWWFGVSQSFRVTENIDIVLQVQRDVVSSNLALYAYTNNSVLLGPKLRF